MSLQHALWGSPIKANPDGTYLPDQLVEVPTLQNGDVSANGLTVLMKLRPELRWSDGQPITADDFVYWQQTELDPATGAVAPYGYDQIASAVARDANTVVLTYRQPFGPYLQYLPFAAPRHAWSNIPDQSLAGTQNVNLTPTVTSGAFMLSAFAPPQSFTMVPNPHYASSTFHQSVLDQLVFKAYPDIAALIAAYQAGQVQQAEDVRLASVPQLKGVPGLHIPPDIGYELVLANLSTLVLQDLHVRKAIAEAIDRCQLIQQAIQLDCTTLQVAGILPRPSPYYDPAATLPVFDLGQARADMQAAGWDCSGNPCTKNGQPFPTLALVTTLGNRLRATELALIQQALAAVGIPVALHFYRAGLLFGNFTNGGILATGQYDLAVFANTFNFDPNDLLFALQSDQIPSAQNLNGTNWGRVANPQLDALSAQGRATVDQQQRLTISKAAEELIANAAYFVPLYLVQDVTLTSPQIVNYASNIFAVGNEWNVGDWWLNQVLAPVTGTAQCGASPLPGATVQLFSGSSLVATTTADANGQFAFPSAAPGVYTVRISSGGATCGYQVTISSSGIVGVNPAAQCPPDALHNHSWISASPLDALGVTPAAAKVDACLYRQDQSAWFKVPIQPGSKMLVSLTNMPANFDLTLYKDIAGAYQTLTSPSSGLTRLSAEFAPDAYSPDAYSPDAYSPDAYSPDAYSPDAYSPDAYSPDAYSPDAYSPDAYSPDAYSPDAYSPDAYSPSAFSPDAYSPATPVQNALTPTGLAGEPVAPAAYAGAQTRSLIGVSAQNGTASEHIVRNTWDNATNFYVRVRGRNGVFNLAQPFHLEVTLLTGACGAIKSVDALTAGITPSLLSGTVGSFNTIIVLDSARATTQAGWTVSDLSAVRSHLASLAANTAGVVVDVSADDRVKAANLQADANPACPYAKNLVALEIKRIIDAYRGLNPFKYVVLVGNDGLIPFFRHPDQAGLASERNFVPPVLDASPSQATLKLGYVLGQDRYGSLIDLSVNDHTLPLPDLAVGRLIERPGDINGLIDAYLRTLPAGGVTPTTSLATGYDFFADAASAIAGQLSQGTSHPADTLIQASGPPTVAGGAWTADQLRAKLLGSRHDVIFLGAHFSAFSAEAADFSSHLLATEVANSTLDWSNVIVFSEGCHSGYNTVDRDAIPIPLVEPDFPQAFAHKGATLIGGSGYQYGDTDFIEYGERLYLEFSKQLRTGTGPVSVGQALVAAKKAYLAATPQLRGIHEKTLLESTLYGLPQLMMNMPGTRITPPVDTSVVGATTPFASRPGSVLGLSSADITVQSTLTPHTVTINSTTLPPAPLTATYLSGSGGQVSNPGEPVLPLEARNVAAPGPPGSTPILRGVGFRGGPYTDNPTGGPVLPLTGAPATELRAPHSFFFSGVLYPVRPWRLNYFDALTGGATTRLDVTPAQYVASGPASQTGLLRAFSSMNFRLFYSDPTLSTTTYGQTASYPGNIPALAAAPAISQVSALPSPDGTSITFRLHVEGDPSAGIQQVWVTYTATGPACSGGPAPCFGQWQSLDLVQDAADSTLWTGTLSLGTTASSDVRYLVQAVNGVGVVGMATNLGAYYVPGPETVPLTAPKQSTAVVFSSAPSAGTYRDRATFTAVVTANGSPLGGRPLVFEFGPQRLHAVTDASGSATVTFPLLQTPGQYPVRAAIEEAPDLLGSASESLFTITRQNTSLTLTGGTTHYSDPTPVVATLADQSTPTTRRLREQTVIFIVSGNGQPPFVLPVITDELGRAPLGPVPLPAGAYAVAAYFSGTIPIPTASGLASLTLTNDRYSSSTTTLATGLTITPELATVAYTGDTTGAMTSPIHVAATVTQETDDLPGDITNATVEFVVKDASGTTVSKTTAAVAADGTASASLAGLPAGLYRIASTVVGGFYTSPTTTVPLAVFNPSMFVTGEGSIITTSPPPNDKAHFDFNVKYRHGRGTPIGNLKFTLGEPGDQGQNDGDNDSVGDVVDANGGVAFKATGFDWLVITGSTAQFEGTGTINGTGSFRFRVIATAGEQAHASFEIHIWDATHSFEAPLILAAGTVIDGHIQIQTRADNSQDRAATQ